MTYDVHLTCVGKMKVSYLVFAVCDMSNLFPLPSFLINLYS